MLARSPDFFSLSSFSHNAIRPSHLNYFRVNSNQSLTWEDANWKGTPPGHRVPSLFQQCEFLAYSSDPIWLWEQMEGVGLQAGLCSINCSHFAQKFEPGLRASILEWCPTASDSDSRSSSSIKCYPHTGSMTCTGRTLVCASVFVIHGSLNWDFNPDWEYSNPIPNPIQLLSCSTHSMILDCGGFYIPHSHSNSHEKYWHIPQSSFKKWGSSLTKFLNDLFWGQ